MDSNSWRWEDYAYLYKHYPKEGAKFVSSQLGRSVSVVVQKAEKLGIHENVPFSPEEVKISTAYGKKLGTALMFLMPERTTHEVEELLQCTRKR